MAVLLIGSTGNGKSALGNFLLNPDEEHLYKKPSFVRARDNVPCTQETVSVTKLVSSPSLKESKELTVVDTPGLNESGEKDLEHMIGLVEKLEHVRDISTCFIVVKFDGKIDTQYKNTVKYYSRLLPVLFEKNLVIVMTDFDCGNKAERKRNLDNIDVQKIEDNTVDEIVKLCGLSCKPMHFKIDSLPDPGEQEDFKKNLKVRDAILSRIFSFDVIKITEFKVQKPNFLVALDDEEKSGLEGEISTKEDQIASDSKALKRVIDRISTLKRKLRDYEAQLRNLRDQRAYYDTSETIDVKKWSVSKGWEFWSKRRDSFNIQSNYPLRVVDKWDDGDCTWTSYNEGLYSVSGSLCSDVWCGLYASVTCKTHKRDKYADEIQRINRESTKLEDDVREVNQDIRQEEEQNSEYSVQLKEHDDFIKERKEKIVKLAAAQMSISDAKERLKILIMAKAANADLSPPERKGT